jgi:molybdate transport system ATP-binding protein
MACPTTLLVDEPLVGLDAHRRPLLPSLTRIVRELRVQVIYITHNAREVEALAECVLRLDCGRVLHAGPPSRVTML